MEFCWYANFALIALAVYFLCRTLFGEQEVDFSTLVRLNAPLSAMPVTGGAIEAQQATLKLRIPTSLFQQVTAFAFFFLFEFLIIGAIYNIRRVLRIVQQSPFTGEAIRRLRYTALFIGLLAPYNFLLSVAQAEVVHAYVPQAEQAFRMTWNFGLPYIAVAAVIYIIVDVFRYGMQLQQENEAFV